MIVHDVVRHQIQVQLLLQSVVVSVVSVVSFNTSTSPGSIIESTTFKMV